MVEEKNILKNRIIYILLLVFISRILMYIVFKGYAWYTGTTKGFVLGLASPWDNGWYKTIVSYGYDLQPCHHIKRDAASWAFFPLDPICIGFVSKVFKISVWKAGIVSNTIFLIIALIYADKYIMLTRRDKKISNVFIWLMTFGPYTFYFSTLYTESLYLMLTMLTFYFMAKQEWIKMGIAGTLLSATRPTGILIVFSIAIFYLIKKYKEKKKWGKVFGEAFKDQRLILGVAMIPMGLFAYMAYLWRLMGDPLAFMRIQKAWGRSDVSFLKLLWQFLSGEIQNGIYFVVFTVFVIMVICYDIYKHRSHEIVTPALILGIQCRSSFLCIPRYMISTGFIWISAAEFIVKHCTVWLRRVIMAILTIISIFFLILWYDQSSFCI